MFDFQFSILIPATLLSFTFRKQNRSTGISIKKTQIQCVSRIFSTYSIEKVGNNDFLRESSFYFFKLLCPVREIRMHLQTRKRNQPTSNREPPKVLSFVPRPACRLGFWFCEWHCPPHWIHMCLLWENSCMRSHFVFHFLHFHELTSQISSFHF